MTKKGHEKLSNVVHSKYSTRYILFTLLILMLILIWHGYDRYIGYKKHQQMLMKHSVMGASAELSALLNQLQYTVSVFTSEHLELIQFLAENPENDEKLETLKKNTAIHFPQYFAVTIADYKGEPLLGNFDLMVNELCQREIKKFIAGGYHYDVFIHPHIDAYHFDVMTPWPYNKSSTQKGIFFISIKPTSFSRVLKNAELLDHKLYLLNTDINGLIEITSEGARVDTKGLNGNYFLSPENINNIGFAQAVPGTLWNLVDIPDVDLISNKLKKIIVQNTFIFICIVIISFFFMRLIRHEEESHFKTEKNLKQTKEKLESALEFSNVATWEYHPFTKSFIWSEHVSQFFGECVPRTYSQYNELIHEDYKADFESFIKKCIESGEPQYFEHKIAYGEKREVWLEINGSLERDNDLSSVKLLGLIRNVTNRKIAEQNHIDFELKQKDTLLREVHHRIKNTLQGVMNLLHQHKNKQNFDRHVFEHAITQLYSVSLIHGINGESSDDKVELSNLVNLICVTAFNISGFDYKPSYSLSKNHIINTIDNNAVAIALIINELVINAIKHTPDVRINEIKVNIITLLDDAVVEIRNPGKNLPKNFDFKNGTGLGTGLTLIRSLLPKQGTEITIRQIDQEVVCHLILNPPILENIYEFKGYRENKSA